MPPSRREDLIDAAMKVFYRSGFHASGLDKILQEGGISRMTLYNHFESKDDLIVAALKKRDRLFREELTAFVEARSDDPIERIDAIFAYTEHWCGSPGFAGCMFVNVAAEYPDPNCEIRKVAADHKLHIFRYLRDLCTQSGVSDPEALGGQLAILLDGATVNAHTVCQGDAPAPPSHPVALARAAAHVLIERALEAPPQPA